MSSSGPIRLHPQNPHYYLFDGRLTVLITSAEHYGAVVNADFDYVAYLDALARYGLNYTRIYPGYLFEPEHKFIRDNTLAPRPESLILPWARGSEPGYILGGNKYDLDTWDEAFFRRLVDFLAQAERRGVVVEICFFNCQYPDTWPLSPLYHANNVQGVGLGDHNAAQTLNEPALALREQAYVSQITRQVNRFDNVILEICDEPLIFCTPPAEAGAWIDRMIQVIQETEAALPKRHLIAQQVQGPLGGPCDFSGDARVPVIVTQYVWETGDLQEGGMKALECEYHHDKPIELNETNYYPVWYKEDRVGSSRVEAWEFMVGGGASFNHLNGLYTVQDPTGDLAAGDLAAGDRAAGDTPENAQICSALRNLMRFLYGFDLARMRREEGVSVRGRPANAHCRGISEPGAQYAIYLHHGVLEKPSVYTVIPGSFVETLEVHLPAGLYRAAWVDPASGATLREEEVRASGGPCALVTPPHAVDIALGLRRVQARTRRSCNIKC